MKHLEGLNEKQKEAAVHRDGPLLIIAGAGAGKTTTIAHRIVNLVKEGVEPESILAVTFTNKAAGEMRERISKMLSIENTDPFGGASLPFMSTFHALGVYLIRRHAGVFGLTRHFSILDKDDSLSRIKASIKELGLDDKKFPPRKIMSIISKSKGDLISREMFLENAQKSFTGKITANVWRVYEEKLAKERALDFDDLLVKTVRLLEENKDLREAYREKWKYVHIDEYQDTNRAQYKMSALLTGPRGNICVVGDVDQSIYSWRGADFTNILNFEKDYSKTKTVFLEENYRSTPEILTAANDIIVKNKNRLPKNLFTTRGAGDPITIYGGANEEDEALFVMSKAKELIGSGVSPDKIAVLYRANFQSRVLEEAFLREGVPYQVLGVRFFERKEVKDLLSYIKAALNPNDLMSLKRASANPTKGIGKVTLAKIAAGQTVTGKSGESVKNFLEAISDIRESIKIKKTSVAVKYALKRSGLEDYLKRGGEDELERLENLKELATIATKYDEFEAPDGTLMMLDEAALVSDQDTMDKNKNGVKLMTVHASKGLEFGNVFVTGLEENLFPHRSLDPSEARDDEEERRLFYVAITRAEKKLFLTYAQSRMIFGSRNYTLPSEFIGDISEDLTEREESSFLPWIELD